MSDSDPLKLLITFRKNTKNDILCNPLYVKEYIEYFFSNFRDDLEDENYEFDFVVSEAKNIDFDAVYQADLYEIEVTVCLHIPQPYNNLFAKIMEIWCNPRENNLSNLWLQIANPSILQNTGKLYHSDVEITEIAFGTLPDMHCFMQHYEYLSNSGEKVISGSFFHSQKKLMIFTCFSHLGNCKPVHYKFHFNYEAIARVIVNFVSHRDLVQVFFQLRHTPFLYIKKTKRKKEEESNNTALLASDQEYQAESWERTLDFGCPCKNYVCPIEKIGRCPVLKIVIPKKHKTYDIIERLIQRCSSDTFFYFTNMKTITWKFNNFEDFENFPFNHERLNQIHDEYEVDKIKFKCQFAWQVLNSRSFEVRDQIALKYELDSKRKHWERVKNKLKSYFCDEVNSIDEITEALSKTFYDISEMVCKNLIFSFEEALETIFKYYLESSIDEKIPDGMCIVRRIILTPSKIIYIPPSEHFQNRVLRDDEFDVENFLRISIEDDNFQKLTYAVQYNSKKEKIFQRVVKTILLEGIFIGPRKYEILAASNSQLREHGLWMYSKDQNGYTAEKIRNYLGNFTHIRNVAKYMARIGQCFSTSDEAVQITLNEDQVIEIDDIEITTHNGTKYNFTDGIGKISKDLAKEVQIVFAERHYPDNLDEDMYDPSAFQIRFRGCKGMLAEARPDDLSGRKIAIRPSMIKFPCSSSNFLEIIKISAPRAVFLNRPLITILENLGVEPKVFMELQKKMVFDLTDSLIYDKKALKILKNCTSLPYSFVKLNKSGISLAQEPFFRSLLLCVYKSLIGNLKRKARIAIPPEYGRNMMGVVDETGRLNYGQIFAQYSEEVGHVKTPTKRLEGTVVVTKNPCMHPGDVRKFEAVNIPELHHLKDCIVFPAKGKRPHPDEMAGSDLDGDEYVVIWEPRLIFPKSNYEAMEYPANEANELDWDVQVEDMVDFICKYIEHDSIGLMANAYLAWADYEDKGILAEVCKNIALKYPQALDFAKSGTTKYLESKERPKFYPDFMEKGAQNNSYKSEKTLGQLYRMIRNLEASVSNVNSDLTFIHDSKLEYEGWKQYENLAKLRRDEYAKRIKSILKKYGLKNEAEALTGYLSDVSDVNRNKYDSENISLLAKKYLFDTIKRFHWKFIRDCEVVNAKDPSVSIRDIKYRMASAWYMVTYQDNDSKIFSFPWVVNELLSEICEQNSNTRNKVKFKSKFISHYDTLLHSRRNEFNRVATCFCMTVLNECVYEWIQKSSFILTESSNDIFCQECFDKIIKHFRSSKMSCCSRSHNQCKCHYSCSPMEIVLQFFKFYAAEVIPDKIRICQNWLDSGSKCEGFDILNVQSLALKTYAIMATAHGLPFLGFLSDNFNNNDPNCIIEGNPIRVKVTEEFENILTGRVDEVCRILKEVSGVKQVYIDGSSDRNAFYILVHSIGDVFHRWYLEELVMDHKCPSVIRRRLK